MGIEYESKTNEDLENDFSKDFVNVFDKIRVLFKENYDRDVYFVKESDISNDMNIYILRSDK